MNKLRTVLFALLIILLPLTVLTLSGNIVLRTSAVYGYHFNDSQVIDKIDSSLSSTEIGNEIAGYFNSFNDEEFQIYEQNGEFQDPMFDQSEILVMRRVKTLLWWMLLGGVFSLVLLIVVYVYLRLWENKHSLRVCGMTAGAASFIAMIVKGVLILNRGFRASLYNRFIGVPLNNESTLKILLGSPLERIYIVFATIIGIALTVLFVYVSFELTKERGMFKEN